ncbi:hypothetical protein HDA32_003714 [Spinactinospora alkalitolerans]|uniref:Uncharacterized protein n=1 Tax=Spinactinospora alkalitolerans TaxID=687207 RepID=A0A852U384_9ACTN|nr:hypothetical protein [Spinactinospora alkalitolerans]NYE48594.1 hypothetical protein [Spinactinospora alkalitolerans]
MPRRAVFWPADVASAGDPLALGPGTGKARTAEYFAAFREGRRTGRIAGRGFRRQRAAMPELLSIRYEAMSDFFLAIPAMRENDWHNPYTMDDIRVRAPEIPPRPANAAVEAR